MGKTIKLLCSIIIVFTASACYSQKTVHVSKPRIEYEDHTIHIYYDILDSDASDRFFVDLVITTETGTVIEAKEMGGDIGENVRGGKNQHITWNPTADNVFLDSEIFFQINASYVMVPSEEMDLKQYKRINLIIQSLVVPGLGMTRVTGKPHWLRAVAGYGCVAGSLILSQQAKKNFDLVSGFSDFEDKKESYDLSIKQDDISEWLAYAAVGVWITDFIWTVLSTREYKTKSLSGSYSGIYLDSSLDPIFLVPTMRFRYKF